MNPRIKTIMDGPITYLENRRDYVCYHDAFSFRIVDSSYKYKKRKLYLTFEILSEFEDGESMFALEEYNVDEIEFYFLIQNLFKPKFDEIVPVSHHGFLGITGQACIYVLNSKIHIDTLSIRIS